MRKTCAAFLLAAGLTGGMACEQEAKQTAEEVRTAPTADDDGGWNISGHFQPTPRPALVTLPSYDFLHVDRCGHLIFPAEQGDKLNHADESADTVTDANIGPGAYRRAGFRTFYGKLNWLLWLGQGHINILHIGGSHVQAGMLSHRIRTRLSDMAPQCAADRGMLFPYRAIPSNAPSDYRIEAEGRWQSTRNVFQQPKSPLGLMGAAVMTDDRDAALMLTLREGGRWTFDTLVVIGEGTTPDVQPRVTLTSDSTARITFDGLRKHYPPQAATKSAKNRKRKTPTPELDTLHYTVRGLLPRRFSWDVGLWDFGADYPMPAPGISYTEAGINGAAVPSWLRCSLLESDLALLPPDLVIMGIGINDANERDFDPELFKSHYRTLIARIRSVSPGCALLFITNNDSWLTTAGTRRKRPFNPNGAKVCQAMMELAEEYDGAVMDVYNLMGGLGSSEQWVKAGLMQRDHVHFTRDGYRLIGDVLYNALIEDYMQYNASAER